MSSKTAGAGFILDLDAKQRIFTPEDFTDEHKMIAAMAKDFYRNEIEPNEDRLEKLDYELTVSLLRQAGELGLLGGDVPERYGGLGLDKVSVALVMECLSGATGFASSVSAHTGIGMLPIVFFGSAAQKSKYLPELAAGTKLAAYCLTEASSGSDALGAKTTAKLSEDGKHYVLNGSKVFITNGGFADVYIVYAKIDGDKFSAFIVERDMPGFTVGPEEKKMGIKASSTCPLYFDNVLVPVENLLGEPGKGHLIAFNILNIGRHKLAVGCIGTAKETIRESATYANTRKQFGTPIAQFPLVAAKLAEMNTLTFALETIVYRTSGIFDDNLEEIDESDPNAGSLTAAAIGEYAIECSINKVFASEALDAIVDEGVQLHGGYGFISEYRVERMYRDSRINRIFEGTNEINRLIIPGTLFKRAAKGELPLLEQAEKLLAELPDFVPTRKFEAELDEEAYLVANAKKMFLMAVGYASRSYGQKLDKEQELLANLAEVVIHVYAMESVLLRTRQMMEESGESKWRNASDMTRLFVHESFDEIVRWTTRTLTMLAEGESLRSKLAELRKLADIMPIDTASLKRRIAERVIASESYTV